MRVAIQGQIGSFHHIAAKQWYGDDVTTICGDTFPEVFGVLNRHDAEAVIVAIENSLYGSINEIYDLIESHGYPVIGEIHLRIKQQLIGTASSLSDITHVYSHPVALAQCRDFLDINLPQAERIEHYDTAAAVEYIKQLNDPSVAAIAGDVAAEIYKIPILEKDIEDNKANYTRFLVLQPNATPPADADRASLVIVANHTPGSLAKILTIIADAGINLSKLQSRPITGSPWKYKFYIVVDAAGTQLHETLKHIQPFTQSITVLGEYKHNL